MKVLFVFHDRTNYTGGPALNAVRLLPHLNKLGVSVISACIYPKGQEHPNGDALEKSGVQVVYK